MRVLTAIIVPPHLAASGGANAAERLSAAMASYCQVTVASMMDRTSSSGTLRHHPTRTWLPPVVPWSRLPPRYRTLFYRSDIADLVRSGAFDIVHLHNPMPALEMRRIAIAARKAGIPYILTTHGFNEIANGHRIYRFGRMQRWLWNVLAYRPVAWTARNAAAVFALSPADLPVLREMHVAPERVSIVPNGVEAPVGVMPTAAAAALNKFGIETERRAGQITCMFLANHTPNKGLPVLIDAFRSLDVPYLLIIGGDLRGDIDYEEFKRSAKPGQQIVVTGHLQNEEIGALMARSDLLVFPTLADTLPLTIFEALGHGLPVVASRVGGIPYQIDDDCGVLVSPGDAVALAHAVARLAGDRPRLAAMAASAKARAATLARWDDAAKLAVRIYQDVLISRRNIGDRAAAAERTQPKAQTTSSSMYR